MVLAQSSPGTVTPGLKTVHRHDPAEMAWRVDWLSMTFAADGGPELPGEFNPAGDDYYEGSVNWSPAVVERQDQAARVALMQRRESTLLAEVQLMASVAVGVSLADWIALPYGRNGYRAAMQAPGGARIDYWPSQPGRFDMNLQMGGKSCDMVSPERMLAFLRACERRGGRPRRIDIALDDYCKSVSPAEVLVALQGPHRVTHAREWRSIVRGSVGAADVGGSTTYLGASGSRQILRVYDKMLESAGAVNSIRWELQARDQPAETLVAALVAAGSASEWPEIFARRLVSFVDFRDAASHSEIERRDRLPWFEALVGAARKASMYPGRVLRSMQQTVDWFAKAVSPTLAVIMSGFGGDFGKLQALIRDGRERWRPRHRDIVAVDRMEVLAGRAPVEIPALAWA